MSCDALYGSLGGDNPANCALNPGVCAGDSTCDMVTRTCKSKCSRDLDCGSGDALCANGLCVTCDRSIQAEGQKAANLLCKMHGKGAACDGSSKKCVACLEAADCEGGDSFACSAQHTCTDSCSKHDECGSQTCDVYAGKCVGTSKLVYVDNRGGGCSGAHKGTKDDPFCMVGDALTKPATMIRVRGSSTAYDKSIAPTGTVTIYGPAGETITGEQGVAQLGGDSGKVVVTVSAGADVTLYGVELVGGSSGVECSGGGKVKLRRSKVLKSDKAGVLIDDNCDVSADRFLASDNHDGGLAFMNAGTYNVTNSFFISNSATLAAAVELGRATGKLQFVTVAKNKSGSYGGINCGANPHSVDDSIIFANSTDTFNLKTSQLTGQCMLNHVVVGMKDMAPGGTQKDPDFVSATVAPFDFRLTDTSGNRDCCIDKADKNPDIKWDYYGTPRPQGSGNDIGAYELVQ